MSALPHFNPQGSSVETFSKAIDAIAPDEWPVFQYLGIIHNLEIEGQDVLKKEAAKPRVEGASWTPRNGSTLKKQIAEALDKNAPKDSLYRRACIEGDSIYPALIIALICNARNNGTLKAMSKKLKLKSKQAPKEGIEDVTENEVVEDVNRDNGKLKSKLTLEEELKVWPTVFFKVLVKRLMIIIAPRRIEVWRDFQDEIKKREGEGESKDKEEDKDGLILVLKDLIRKLMEIFENENELHSRKRPRIESPRHINPPSTNGQPLDPAQPSMVAVRSHVQDHPTQQAQPISQAYPQAQPHPQPQSQPQQPQPHPHPHPHLQHGLQPAANPINEEFVFEKFTVSGVEFNKSLLKCLGGKKCRAQKVGLSSESPVRVDPYGTKDGILLIFLGQTAKNLAKRAVPVATSKHRRFLLPSTHLYDHVQELIEPGDNFEMVYCQGIGIVWMPPDYFLVLVQKSYVVIRDDIRRARGESVQTLQKPR